VKKVFPYGYQSDFNLTVPYRLLSIFAFFLYHIAHFHLFITFSCQIEATHDFVAPMSPSGVALAAIYHGATPAWGVNAANTLYGNILRNSPGGTPHCAGYGADGSDNDVHSILFALRVPTGLQDPSTGTPSPYLLLC